MEYFISIVCGVLTGIISSFLVWWYLYCHLSPKIEFSKKIIKRPSESRGCKFSYQFRLQNSRSRNAFNVQLEAQVVFPNFPTAGIRNLYPVPLDSDSWVYLPPGNDGRKGVFLELDDDKFREIFLTKKFFNKDMKKIASDGELSLEDVLSATRNSYVRIRAIATHSTSTAVNVFSVQYELKDITESKFKKHSLEVEDQN
jgi:hypothetical protein